ncbi:MAG: fibronectin type III domain-containing protein [Spirochaetales bacterium]|nr:fibronectin type III domain-containing protein [Spirochaetales bacterium]
MKKSYYSGLVVLFILVFTFSCEKIPEPVADLAGKIDDGSVTLTWSYDAESEFEIWYGKEGDQLVQFLGEPNPSGTVITGLENGSAYRFEVYAVNQSGDRSPVVDEIFTPNDTLGALKASSKKAIDDLFLTFDEDDYSSANWTDILDAMNSALSSIDSSVDADSIVSVRDYTLARMDEIMTNAELDAVALADAKVAATTAVLDAFSSYVLEDYSSENWDSMIARKDAALISIDESLSIQDVNDEKQSAIDYFEAVFTLEEEADIAEAQDDAREFEELFSDVLAMTIQSVQISDRARVESADVAFGFLSTLAQSFVSVTDLFFDQLLERIYALEVEDAQASADALKFETDHSAVIFLTIDSVSVGDRVAVEAAISDFENLSLAAIAKLSDGVDLDFFNSLLDEIVQQQAVVDANLFLADYGDVVGLTLSTVQISDRPRVEEALVAYQELSDLAKDEFSFDESFFNSLLDKISDLEAEDAAAALEASLFLANYGYVASLTVDTVVPEDFADIETAEDAYLLLSSLAQEKLLPQISSEFFTDLYDKIEQIEQEDLAIATNIIEEIDNLPVDIQYSDKAAVDSASSNYSGLLARQKLLVTNYQKLVDAEAAIEGYEQEVDDFRVSLGDLYVDELEIGDLASVNGLEDAFTALSVAQQALLSAAELSKYNQLLTRMDEIVADHAAAADVEALIDGLPAANLINLSDKPDVVAVRSEFDSLTGDQQLLVDNLSTLEACELRIEQLETAAQFRLDHSTVLAMSIDTVTVEDKPLVDAARADYLSFSNPVKILLSSEKSLLDALFNKIREYEILINSKASAKAELQAEVEANPRRSFTSYFWSEYLGFKDAGEVAIDSAVSVLEVSTAKNGALLQMRGVMQIADIDSSVSGDYLVLGLDPSDDTGYLNNDSYTSEVNDIWIWVEGPADSEISLILYEDNLGFVYDFPAVVDSSGSVSIEMTFDQDLVDGEYSVVLYSRDLEYSSDPLVMVVDTTSPEILLTQPNINFGAVFDSSFFTSNEDVVDFYTDGLDLNVAGLQSYSLNCVDKAGNVGTFSGQITVNNPTVVNLVNRGFEDGVGLPNWNFSSTGGDAPGWQIDAHAYLVYIGWTGVESQQSSGPFRRDERSWANYFYCYVRRDSADATGSAGNILWFCDSNSCGGSCWYARSWGTARQKMFKVYKNVTYKFSAYLMNGGSDNPSPPSGIRVQASEGHGSMVLSPSSNNYIVSNASRNDGVWELVEITFSPDRDGYVDLILEKYNKSGDRDGGWTHFDQSNFEIVGFVSM